MTLRVPSTTEPNMSRSQWASSPRGVCATRTRESATAPIASEANWSEKSGTAPNRSACVAVMKPRICAPNWTKLARMTVRWIPVSATSFRSASRAGVTNACARPIAIA